MREIISWDDDRRHGQELKKHINKHELSEDEARKLVQEAMPQWSDLRVDRWFAAAGLFGYVYKPVISHYELYQDGKLIC
jgi:hypothetical protein